MSLCSLAGFAISEINCGDSGPSNFLDLVNQLFKDFCLCFVESTDLEAMPLLSEILNHAALLMM